MNIPSLLGKLPTLEEAERAGRDCGVNGANESNCHFKFFASRELTTAWERGCLDVQVAMYEGWRLRIEEQEED